MVILICLVLWYCGPWRSSEHAYLAAPTFNKSLVDKYRDFIKDNRGMTLDDYALESHIVTDTPLSGEYKIL
jgi:hypothetical protein